MTSATAGLTNATVEPGFNRRQGYSAADRATNAWHRGVLRDSRELILERAVAKLQRLTALADNWDGEGAFKTHPFAAVVLTDLLRHLVQDDPATPQIAPTHLGGAEAEWLANRQSLRIEVEPSGTISITAEDASSLLIDEEFSYWDIAAHTTTLDMARQMLEKLNHHAVHPVPPQAR